jgi:SAM-dependent methyltransferase
MSDNAKRLYWLGNAAKTRIISELLVRSQGSELVTVFDYGCGDGGDWPCILGDHPYLRLVAFEPETASYQKASQRLQGCNALVLSGETMTSFDLQADYIVSFSVFEHVVNQPRFLRHAKRVLAPGGLFYLNYDDGHFRNFLDVAELATWLPALRARLHTLVSPLLAALGRQASYQRRVVAAAVDRLVTDCGFRIERIDYHNLSSLKDLAKSIPEPLREEYARWWLEVELDLNRQFATTLDDARYGDSVNLWWQMGSRTLCLRHS